LQTNNGQDFYQRVISTYTPWDPGNAATLECRNSRNSFVRHRPLGHQLIWSG
jgi:hypothetical protein